MNDIRESIKTFINDTTCPLKIKSDIHTINIICGRKTVTQVLIIKKMVFKSENNVPLDIDLDLA